MTLRRPMFGCFDVRSTIGEDKLPLQHDLVFKIDNDLLQTYSYIADFNDSSKRQIPHESLRGLRIVPIQG